MIRIAFVQLGSNGDVVSLLPCFKHHADMGKQVDVYTRPPYTPVLDAVSYAKAIPVKRRDMECMNLARELAGKYDEVIVSQVAGNQHRTARGTQNYQCEHWERCGLLDKIHDLPTVIDRRDEQAELQAIQEWMPAEDGRPLLAYNLSGVSSPYAHATEQREWIKRTFGASHRLIDLGALHLKSVMLLLPFIEQAEVLITVDTATVHLAHATMTPTVVFLPEARYPRSEPRQHWVYACTHDQSVTPDYRHAIAQMVEEVPYSWQSHALIRPIPDMVHPYVFHVVNYFWINHGEDKNRVMEAYPTWEARRTDLPGFRTVFFEEKHGAGPGALLTDVIDHAVSRTMHDGDVILHASRHAPIPAEAMARLKHINRMEEVSPGCFAFSVSWWRQNRRHFQFWYTECEGCEEAMRMIGVTGNLVLAV